jgi:hypothetical protein
VIESLRRVARRTLRRFKAGALVDVYRKGSLVEHGWFESFKTLEAVDRRGEPLPWYTYGFISFLEPRLTPEMRVFEYGSGNSTRWYSRRVKEVVAVEHDPAWASKVRADLGDTSSVNLQPPGPAYVNEVGSHGPFDIVVIDGIEELRPECARAALAALTDEGVLIWDNSDRAEFAAAFPELERHGFRQLAWAGMGPTAVTGWETSVLYRERNCLGI